MVLTISTQRAKAWSVHPYPCIGLWSFLSFRAASTPTYRAAVARLRSDDADDALVDLGCGLGQLLRRVRADGVPGERLFGVDLHAEFLELGYELFRDRDGLGATMVAGDLLAPDPQGAGAPGLAALDGKVTVVHAAHFFHLFAWEEQIRVGKRMVKFLRPGVRDAVIFGRQIGSTRSDGHRVARANGERFVHGKESWQRLWDEVGDATGTTWRTEVEVLEGIQMTVPGFGQDARYIRWTVRQAEG